MVMGKPEYPDRAQYIRPYDDISSQGSADDILEKAEFLSQAPSRSWRRRACSTSVQILIHGLLLLINVFLSTLYIEYATAGKPRGLGQVNIPARDSMEYERRIFELDHIYLGDYKTLNSEKPTKFNGPPSPELEDAWDDLTKHQNLRLTREEIGDYADSIGLVELPDGGFFGTLTVYHSLHCVRRLHNFMYLDEYYPGIEGEDYLRLKGHAEHCLDTLRQNIQCGADASVQAFHWGTTSRVPLSHDAAPHECVNWEVLDSWSAERKVDVMAPGYLTHPTLGLAFPNGTGDRLGLINDKILGSGDHMR